MDKQFYDDLIVTLDEFNATAENDPGFTEHKENILKVNRSNLDEYIQEQNRTWNDLAHQVVGSENL